MEQAARRRQAAERLLASMSDAELRAVLAAQRAATWRLPKLVEHHRDHRAEWPKALGLREPTLDQYAALGPDLAASWDRAFLAVEPGGPTWVFVRQVEVDTGLVAAIRRGRIRTTMVAAQLARWIERQLIDHGAIEVTARAHPV